MSQKMSRQTSLQEGLRQRLHLDGIRPGTHTTLVYVEILQFRQRARRHVICLATYCILHFFAKLQYYAMIVYGILHTCDNLHVETTNDRS